MRSLILAGIIGLLTLSTLTEARSLQVASDGEVTAYYVGGSASYDLNMFAYTGGVSPMPMYDLPEGNLTLGTFSAGDYFGLRTNVADTGDNWWDDKTGNSDGLEHYFLSSFSLPDGTAALFVGVEDLYGGGDMDYNDQMYVFTNVMVAVPEPSTYAMLIAGLLILVVGCRHSGDGGSNIQHSKCTLSNNEFPT